MVEQLSLDWALGHVQPDEESWPGRTPLPAQAFAFPLPWPGPQEQLKDKAQEVTGDRMEAALDLSSPSTCTSCGVCS